MSNLLEKASIVTTPTAYDNGKILSVKPTSGIGDFDFTRNSSATRVNSQGLIEDVQILSSNLVQNGDFSQEGSELITNGNFATDSDWILGSGWNIGGGKAVAINSASGQKLRQAGQLTASKTYKLVYEVTEITLGGFLPIVGAVAGTAVYSIGTYTEYITTINDDFYIRTLGTTSGSIDNVSVKEVGQDWTLGTGWSIGASKAISDATQGYISQTNVGAAGVTATYKVQWTQNITAGARLRFFARNYNDSGNETILSGSTTGEGSFGLNGNSVGSGTFTAFASSTNGYSFKILAEAGVEADISNISVIEITDDTNLPRIDYTGGTGHWLFEPQSTNLIPNANQYSGNTVYYTVTPNQSSPDGENNATLFVEKTATANYFVNSDNASIVGGQTYAYSFFVKYAGLQNLPANASDGISGFSANIDILNGTVNSGTAEIKDFGNGWFRVSMTRTVAASASNAKIQFNFGNQTGDGTSGFYLFGFQIEQLSYATSYIPTNGSTVTRLQDAAFGAGSSDLISSTEGVLYAEIAALADDGTNRNISLSKDTGNRVNIFYRNGSNRIRFIVRVNNINVFDTTINLSNITNYSKVALSFKENEFKVYINGVKEAEQLSGSIYPTDTLDKLGFNQNISGGSPFYGKTKCVAVFKEALTDAELTCLTTI